MSENTSRTDPRIARTQKLLGDALRDLIVELGYDSITVQDISDRAEVSRTTFYLHFKDKDELLFTSMRRIYDDLTRAHQSRLADVNSLDDIERAACDASDYQHVAQYADFYRAMLGKHGSAAFIQQVMNYLTDEMSKAIVNPASAGIGALPIPPAIIAAFLAGAQIGMINWWLQNDMQHSAEEMALMQYRLSIGGLMGVLGMIGEKNEPSPSGEE
ncbi:MAG: TetR/AcrR family transcriptional regulator [Anaerolineae bacterium]|nr:TetR/AcrR family transcriptional regulator [Anaerolineae bacterium]